MTTITLTDELLTVSDHCFDHIDGLSYDDIADAVAASTRGFISTNSDHLPVVYGNIGWDRFGFVVDPARNLIISVLPERDAEYNESVRGRYASEPVEVVVI